MERANARRSGPQAIRRAKPTQRVAGGKGLAYGWKLDGRDKLTETTHTAASDRIFAPESSQECSRAI